MYELTVMGMTCGGCVNSVTKAIKAVDAGADVKVEMKDNSVKVESKVALEQIVSAIKDAGFTVK